jgi:hypothetical protein
MNDDGALILDAVLALVRLYVVMTDEQAAAAALWVAHTHAIPAAEATPYLSVQSAEKRSGKSRLLDVLELVVARPWRVIQPSQAVLFRNIEKDRPTLLLDEVDTFSRRARTATTRSTCVAC